VHELPVKLEILGIRIPPSDFNAIYSTAISGINAHTLRFEY
jgi:hypothetical protein